METLSEPLTPFPGRTNDAVIQFETEGERGCDAMKCTVGVSATAAEVEQGPDVQSQESPMQFAQTPDEFRRDAKIWKLYLEEAEKEAKERAESWKTGLDSLLVFAGLFAGVVASFVADSRKDLQPDPQQVLLTDIRNTLLNGSPTVDVFSPTTSSVWINGLWFSSLLITLFSAILAVLAKGWIVKFIPVTTQHESQNAYERWVIDERASRWHLENVISLMPLLLQLALLLFCLGFTLQALDDNATLGRMVLSVVVVWIGAYFVMTFLPLFRPSSPFQTPLSDILLRTQKVLRPLEKWIVDNASTVKKTAPQRDKNEALAEIWDTKLLKSTNPSHVDAAIAELTHKPLSFERWKFFIERDVSRILLERLKEHITPGFNDKTRHYEVLCHHLQALWDVVQTTKTVSLDKAPVALERYLEPGNPLYRWNIFPDEIRGLAFAIRTPILIKCDKDLADAEVEEQPWESMVYYMLPTHKRKFALAACQGLVGQHQNLKVVSRFSLVLLIVKALENGLVYEWEWGADILKRSRQETEQLARNYLAELFRDLVKGWKTTVIETMMRLPSIATIYPLDVPYAEPSSFLVDLDAGRVYSSPALNLAIVNCILLLISEDHPNVIDAPPSRLVEILLKGINTSHQGGRILLSKILERGLNVPPTPTHPPHPQGANNSEFSKKEIRLLALILRQLAINAINEDLRKAGLPRLSHDAEKTIEIISIIEQELQKPLLKKMRGPHFFISIFPDLEGYAKRRTLLATILEFLSRLLYTSFESRDFSGLHAVARFIFTSLGSMKDEFAALIAILPTSITDFFSKKQNNSPSWDDMDSTECYVSESEFRESWAKMLTFQIRNTRSTEEVSKLIEIALKDDDAVVRAFAVQSLASLLRHCVPICDNLSAKIDIALTESDSNIRSIWVTILSLLDKIATSTNNLEKLFEISKNDESLDVRTTATKSIPLLIAGRLRQGRSITLPEGLQDAVLNEPRKEVRAAWAESLAELVRILEDSAAAHRLIQMGLEDVDESVRNESITASLSVRDTKCMRDIIKYTLSKRVVLALENTQWRTREAWIQLLACLVVEDGFKEMARRIVHVAISHPQAYVRAAAVESLTLIGKDVIESHISYGLDLELALQDENARVRQNWIIIFGSVAQISGSHEDMIRRMIIVAVKDEFEACRFAAVKALTVVLKSDHSRLSPILAECLDAALNETEWQVRVAWVEFIAALATFPSGEFNSINILLQMAMYDTNDRVRSAGVNFLFPLVKNGAYTFEDTLSSVTEPIEDIRRVWVNIFTALANYSAQKALGQLINMALEDESGGIRLACAETVCLLMTQHPDFMYTMEEHLSRRSESIAKELDVGVLAWVDILTNLIKYCNSEASLRLLIALGLANQKSNVQIAAVESLQSLLKRVELWPLLPPDFEEKVTSVIQTSEQVCGLWIDILSLLAEKVDSSAYIKVLINISLESSHTQVRKLGVRYLTALLNHPKPFGYMRELLLHEKIYPVLDERDGKVRAEWVKMLADLGRKSDLPDLIREFIETAMKDKDENVRVSAVRSLISLAKSNVVFESIFWEHFESSSSDISHEVRGAWIQSWAALPRGVLNPKVHNKLLEIAVHDEDVENRLHGIAQLTHLLNIAAFRRSIKPSLSKKLDSVLLDHSLSVRRGWIEILVLLADDIELPGDIIVKISRIAINDHYKDVFSKAINLLSSLFVNVTLRDTINTALQENIKSALKTHDHQINLRTIERVSILSSTKPFQEVVRSILPQLLQTVMSHQREDSNHRVAGQDLLKDLAGLGMLESIIDALPSVDPSVIVEGKDFLIELVGSANIQTALVRSVTHSLTILLSHKLGLIRATTLDLLGALYKKHEDIDPQILETSIPEVLKVALEDNDENIRSTGLYLLSKFARYSRFRNSIARALPQLLQLLESLQVRAPTIELISVLAIDDDVRKVIIQHIIALASTKGPASLSDGLTEVILRLILDKRFNVESQPMDNVVVALASVLIVQPQLAKYRFPLAIGLWGNYWHTGLNDEGFPQELLKLFIFTLFGRHVTPIEVEKWRSMGKYLPPVVSRSSQIYVSGVSTEIQYE